MSSSLGVGCLKGGTGKNDLSVRWDWHCGGMNILPPPRCTRHDSHGTSFSIDMNTVEISGRSIPSWETVTVTRAESYLSWMRHLTRSPEPCCGFTSLVYSIPFIFRGSPGSPVPWYHLCCFFDCGGGTCTWCERKRSSSSSCRISRNTLPKRSERRRNGRCHLEASEGGN